MYRALIMKELREAVPIAAIALAAYGCIVGCVLSDGFVRSLRMIPLLGSLTQSLRFGGSGDFLFISGQFTPSFTLISICTVIAFGFRQSVGESIRGTYPFLLHRPMSRRRVIGTKLAVGVVLYLTVAAMPILFCGIWLATPGTHPSPFEWSMTVPTWNVWMAAPILYLGAFLSGVRPGRWPGSRLLPLAAAGLLFVIAVFIPWWLSLQVATVLVASAWFVSSIFFVVQTRDFS